MVENISENPSPQFSSWKSSISYIYEYIWNIHIIFLLVIIFFSLLIITFPRVSMLYNLQRIYFKCSTRVDGGEVSKLYPMNT